MSISIYLSRNRSWSTTCLPTSTCKYPQLSWLKKHIHQCEYILESSHGTWIGMAMGTILAETKKKHASCHSCHKDFIREAMIAFSTVCCCFCWISISRFGLNKSITVDESINNSTYITPSWRAQSSQTISCWSHVFPMSLFCSLPTFDLSPCIPHTDRLKPVTLALVLELMTSNCWKLVRQHRMSPRCFNVGWDVDVLMSWSMPASSKWPFDSPNGGHVGSKRGHFEEPGS